MSTILHIGSIVISLLWCQTLSAFPQKLDTKKEPSIGLSPSHIVILQTDAEFLYGSYYFAVSNTTGEEKPLATTLRLPRESIDFKAAEGLTNAEISILDDGVLQVNKTFKTGLSLVGIQFKVPVHKDGANILTFVPTQNLPHLFVATQQGDLLRFHASGFVSGIPPMLSGGNYSGIQGQNIPANQSLSIEITGFPGGRLAFWILAVLVGLLLIGLAAALTMRTNHHSSTKTATNY